MSTTALTEVRYDWPSAGTKHNGTEPQKARLRDVFAALDAGAGEAGWLQPPVTLGMMTAMALDAAIEGFRLPNVTHVGLSTELSPFSLIAIRAHFSSGGQRVEFLLVDCGDTLTPVAIRVHPMTVAPHPQAEPIPA